MQWSHKDKFRKLTNVFKAAFRIFHEARRENDLIKLREASKLFSVVRVGLEKTKLPHKRELFDCFQRS